MRDNPSDCAESADRHVTRETLNWQGLGSRHASPAPSAASKLAASCLGAIKSETEPPLTQRGPLSHIEQYMQPQSSRHCLVSCISV
ncbi:hypothetical protein PC116_g15392 [Phytophthora cactorum]|uniref:Uncharacterized protein n=1 Tax=Phytophthora cactorum TaxID=29920 RepID=A0A8T1KKF2_9STRA|nr:hypothetical protein PC114_g13437 [Phytophthora cactorum]KAG2931401.1 hypothetical protein PC117_g13476 [Phytophthora cactorum]KAG3015133.1 hypothetical protein PC120_g12310 [Phytophthora cactorum]KAG3036731.1 hypothetical protein PC119_g4204 [Phytophthora cactorum]KAG3185583.1 hypothetical protein C6341_g4344 [Phytophthora cactorum]